MAITKVTNSLVATNAIQGTLIADNAITSVHIAQNQVTAVQIPDGSITSTQIAANSIDTAELVTGSIDTIHIGDSQVTTAKIADLNVTTGKIANNAITAAKIPDGSITATQLDSSTAPTFGNITTTGSLRGPASFTIDPAAVGDNTGTVVIAGDLQVDGTTTTVNSTTLSVADKNIVIASGAADAAAANDAGLTVTGASATLLYKSSGDKWEFNKALSVTTGGINVTGVSIFNTDIQLNETVKIKSTESSGGSHLLLRDDNLGVTSNSMSLVGLNDILIGAKSNNAGTGNIYFGVGAENKASGSGWTDTLTILEGGNVGIATTSPAQKLDVVGAIKVSDGILNAGAAGSASIFNEDGTTADFRVESTSNTHMLFVDGGLNRVGIGTASPAGDLHVVGATGSAGRIYVADADNGTTATDSLLLTKSGDTAFVYNRESSGDLQLGAGDTPGHVVIKSSGNVGIGEADPDGELHVKGTSGGNGDIYVERTSGAKIHLQAQSANGKIGTSSNHNLGLNTNATTRMTIEADGDVGIGTGSPYAKLNVQGTSASTYTGSGPGTTIRASQGTDGNWIASDVDGKFAYFGVDGNDAKFAAYNYATSAEMGMVLGQDRVRIASNGRVSIGTSSANAGLTVSNGDIRTTSPAFANDANSVSMSYESSSTGGGLAVRGPNGSTHGKLFLSVNEGDGGNGRAGIVIEPGGQVTKQYQPSFNAYSPAVTTTTTTIIFGNTRHNIGSGYSTSTGIFTAPVAGVYQFHVYILMNPGNNEYGRVVFRINDVGSNMESYGDTLTYVAGEPTYYGLGLSANIYMAVNDNIRVYNAGQWDTYGTSYGAFSGMLIG